MKLAEVTFDIDTGAQVIDYMRTKSPEAFSKKMRKMIKKGKVKLGPVSIDAGSIIQISCKFYEVH